MDFPGTIELALPIGMGAENLKLPDPELALFYLELNDRHIWLDTDITPEDCSFLIRWVQYLNRTEANNKTPITIHIASPGGHLSAMFTLYHTLINSEIPIHTINEGGAHSAAFIIFLAGDVRTMNPDVTFIAHEGSGGIQGTYKESKSSMKQYEAEVKRMKEMIAERTDFTVEELTEQFDRESDFYITYEIAKAKRVITE